MSHERANRDRFAEAEIWIEGCLTLDPTCEFSILTKPYLDGCRFVIKAQSCATEVGTHKLGFAQSDKVQEVALAAIALSRYANKKRLHQQV